MLSTSQLFESVQPFMRPNVQRKYVQHIENITGKSTAKKILVQMEKAALEQAVDWPGYKRGDKFYLYQPNISATKKHRFGGHIACSDGHSSDVVCLYDPKTKRYTIEKDGVNG